MLDIQFLFGFVIGLFTGFMVLAHYFRSCFKAYTEELHKQYKRAYDKLKEKSNANV